MRKILKKFKLIIIAALLYVFFALFNREIFLSAVNITKGFLVEMLQVLPPVLIITALISVWIPGETIRRGLGQESGIKGRLLSLFIGAFSAGPIYAAFPAAMVLFKKGTSLSNVVIILSSWAVIKIPMLLVETSFLGFRFMISRLVLTIPAILILGEVTGRLVDRKDVLSVEGIKKEKDRTPETSISSLPGLNCGGCGYPDCNSFSEAVESGKKNPGECIILKENEERSARSFKKE